MVTNRRTVEDDGQDFYPTPPWATHALMLNETFTGHILEPACGDGAMSEVIKAYNEIVTSTDIYDHGYEDCFNILDFLELQNGYRTENIITNPPYNIADDFVKKALFVADKKVAFLMRLAYLEGQARHGEIFTPTPPSRVWVFSERITFYKKGADVKGSGTTAYAWFVWDKEDKSGKTELKWLPPIYKKTYGNRKQSKDSSAISI
jgi:hypothetical protein